MIGVLGDIHGFYEQAAAASRAVRAAGGTALIQVGDWGFRSGMVRDMTASNLQFDVPTYVIDGNHEDFHYIEMMKAPISPITEFYPNVFYVHRGSVVKIDNKYIGFLGGAASIDKAWRTEGMDWWPQEQITNADETATEGWGPIDLLITHAPPQWLVRRHFERDPYDKVRRFGVPVDWSDPSADIVERVHKRHPVPLICGHMHRGFSDSEYPGSPTVMVLDECQLITIGK